MGFFKEIYSLLVQSPDVSVFLSTFFLGDEMVYLFGFLSGSGIMPISTVIIFSVLGNGGCDLFWLSLFRYTSFGRKKGQVLENEAKRSEEILENMNHGKIFFSLLMSKFFYGTRLVTLFYVVKKEKNFKKIILYNVLAVVVWVSGIGALMWYLGRWTSVSFEAVSGLHKMVSLVVFFIVVIFLVRILILKKPKRADGEV